MKVGIGTVAAQFLFWEYLFRIVGIATMFLKHLLSQHSGAALCTFLETVPLIILLPS